MIRESASRPRAADVSSSRAQGRNGQVSAVETINVAGHDSERLFGAGFWLECEREADRMLRAITGADDE